MPSKKKIVHRMGSSRKNKVKTAHCFISMASIVLSVVHNNVQFSEMNKITRLECYEPIQTHIPVMSLGM